MGELGLRDLVLADLVLADPVLADLVRCAEPGGGRSIWRRTRWIGCSVNPQCHKFGVAQ
jgi:hypothetical protein